MDDAYIIYIEKFGKIQSGAKIEDQDYKQGSIQFDERGTLAVALAALDVKRGVDLRTRSNFEQELKRFLEK